MPGALDLLSSELSTTRAYFKYMKLQMAALARGPAMKGGGGGGGGDKKQQVGSRLPFVAVGCLLLFVVLTLSSRYNASVLLDTQALVLSGRGDFRPSSQGGSVSHGEGELKQQLAQQSNDDKAGVTEAAEQEESGIRGESNDVGRGSALEEAELESRSTAADATTSNSDEQAKPGDMAREPASGSVNQNQQRQPLCDLSGSRSDVCDLTGDIRLDANASSFVVVVDPTATGAAANGPATYKVRPYARKGDATSMSRVTEITVRTTTSTADAAPPAARCTVTHAEPAVVFSIGGYAGNLFHDFTDVIVPLYGAARRYRGDVRLVVADAAGGSSWRWLAKYEAVLRGLSRHPPLDLAKAAAATAAAGEVHCFGHVVVGLRAHRELMIAERDERGMSSGPDDDGVGMPDFARFLRRALSLPRDDVVTGRKPTKPRLLIVARRGTRRLLNAGAVARAAEEVGFEAVVSELDSGSDDGIAEVGRRINSFDAMVGVHGAGLTNMVFLPRGATVVQVVPWGGLQWIARMDFGDPAEAMGLRYVQYEIAVHESSLRDRYPSDHEVFTNPTALHKKGFKFLRHTFLIGQDVTLDVDRFRVVLLQALHNLTTNE